MPNYTSEMLQSKAGRKALKTRRDSEAAADSNQPSGSLNSFDSAGTKAAEPVAVSVTEIVLPTYMPAAPDKNPMFLEKRVYQGSSGRVYPLPFTDRIAEKPVPRKWKAVWIENEFIRALVLPEIGGRIHAMQDKTNGCDLLYN